MSLWITDRLPNKEDCASSKGTFYEDYVWTMVAESVETDYWYHIEEGIAWQPIVIAKPEPYVAPPEPYVKPKRWQIEWDSRYHLWLVRDAEGHIGAVLCSDIPSPEKYRIAAEQITAIYNEVMP